MRPIFFESLPGRKAPDFAGFFVLVGMVLVCMAVSPAAGQSAHDIREVPGSIAGMGRLGAEEGWVLTDDALLITDDGGLSWSDIGFSSRLEAISGAFFLSASRVWLAGVSPGPAERLVVADTADGGLSWREREVEASGLARGREYVRARVHFLDADRGWLIGQVATSSAFSVAELLRTADGGATWQRLPRPPAAGRILFVDSELGFMTGAPVSERLYRTLDGGWSWQELERPIAAALGTALYDLPIFHTEGLGTLVVTLRGDLPRVISFTTRDGGDSWLAVDSMELPPGDYDEPVPIAVGDSGRVLAVAARGEVVFGTGTTSHAHSLASKDSPTPSAVGSRAPSARALSLAGDGSAWVLVAEGGCDGGACRQVTRLVAVDGSGPGTGRTADLLVRFREEPQPEKRRGAVSKAGVISLEMGFDKCAAGTTTQMQTWWDQSPYADANIYFGGAARACSQANLDASWVATVFDQGWRLIPTWVGPQAPCTGFIRRFSSDPVEAREDGLVEADAAVAAAAALELGNGTPLYYDLEYYDENDESCSAAVREFINAWTERVRDHGYLAGAYGNARNVQNDWIPGVIANPPDAVWLTPWVCGRTASCDWTPTVFGVPGLEDSYWADYQRIRQYWGPHTETYGGVTFEIDGDYANGPVAAASPSASCWQIVPSGNWKGEYFDNTSLRGGAVMLRDDGAGALDFDWGAGSPGSDCGVPTDQFSVRWTRTVYFDAGTYRFTVTGDDGVRLSIDGVLEIDEWRGQSSTTYETTVRLPARSHDIRLEYYENTGGAVARLSWKRIPGFRRVRARHSPS